jgi:thiamine-phosphate pyrophosphorylase
MDHRLVAWGRAVKARNARRGWFHPPLFLFTDATRLADPLPAVARLPVGLCGVVFRHDGVPDRAALGRQLARICRARRLMLVVAGDPHLAWTLRAGEHLRGGRNLGIRRICGFPATSSAHGPADLVRARRAGALAFLSPVFTTASHHEAQTLGPLRFGALAGRSGGPCLALGGVTGANARRLPMLRCSGAGAITGLS